MQSWEKLKRNAEIYRRYLTGEDSAVLGRAFGLSDRRIRDIIEHERKRMGQYEIAQAQAPFAKGSFYILRFG